MKKNTGALISGMAACLVIFGGCSGQASGSRTVFPDPIEISTRAVLDTQSASIVLPLDQYGMNEDEFQTVLAAQQIVFSQCVTGSATIPEATRNVARDTLQYRSPSQRWLYGFWDASYIATHEWQTPPGDGVPLGEGLEVEPSKAKTCVAAQEYLDLFPVKVGYVGSSAGFDNLTMYSGQAFQRTVADSRFVTLMETRSKCIATAGYAITDDGSFNTIELDASWNDEQTLKAVLVAAQCDDDENITQKAGDINATYQQQYVDANQAELTTIKKISDERVAKAEQILKDAGVM